MAGMFDDLPDAPAGSAAPAPKGMFDDLPNVQPHANLPDIGPPAFDLGQFSPGVPAINNLADAASQSTYKAMGNVPGSAYQLAENVGHIVAHPIDAAMGTLKLVAGAAQYAGVPGEQFKPYAKAAADAVLDRYGSLANARKTFEEDPVGFSADVASVVQGGAGLLRKLGPRAARVPPPLPVEPAPLPVEPAPDIPRQTPRPGAGVDLLPPETPHTLPPERRSLGAAGAAGPLADVSPDTVQFLREQLQKQYTPHSLDSRLEEMSAHQFLGELDENTEALMGGAASGEGPGKVEVIQSEKQRHREAPERVRSELDSAFGPAENMSTLERLEKQAQKNASDPLYKAFRETVITPTDEIRALMPKLKASGVLPEANKLMEMQGIPEKFNFLTEASPRAFEEVLTPQAFQHAKEALDDRIGALLKNGEPRKARAYIGVRNELLAALDNHPNIGDAWRNAREMYASFSDLKTARELGRDILSNKIHPDEVPYAIEGYSQAQMRALRIGLRGELETQLGGKELLQKSMIDRLLSPNNVKKIQAVIDQEKADNMITAIRHEAQMHGAGTRIYGGSQTAPRNVVNQLFNPQPQKPGVTLSGMFHAVASPKTAALKLGSEKLAEHAMSKAQKAEATAMAKRREEAARIFTLQGPERDAVARHLIGGEGVPPPTRARGGKVSQDGPAQAARTRAYRAAGGRIHKEGGGELSDEDLAAMAPETFAHPYLKQAARAVLPDQHTTEKYPFLPRPSDWREAFLNSADTMDWMTRSGAEGMRSGNPLKMGLGFAQSTAAPFMHLMAPVGATIETVKKAAGRTFGPPVENAVDVASWVNPGTLMAGVGKTAMAVGPTVRAFARRQAEAAAAAAKAEMSAAPLAEPAAKAYKGAEGAADVTEPAVQAAAGQEAGRDVPPRLGGAPGGSEGVRAAELQAERRASGREALPGLPTGKQVVNGELFQPGPVARAHEVAERYMADKDFGYAPPEKYHEIDKVHARRIANAYERMKHDPTDPKVAASYEALIRETLAQYQAIKESGLKLTPVGEADYPYHGNPRAMTKDVADNNHMAFFRTRDGFGSGEIDQAHPMLRPSGEKIGDEELLNNDLFRIVHDYFGHVKNGYGFRAAGEDNAFRAHAAMYSPEARPAMTTETRGQNSWLNYGPHGDKNRTANAIDTIYAEQKAGLLPAWTMRDRGGYYEGEGGINAGVDAPPNKKIQTVADPYRMMFPGIYRNPREIADEAAARVGPEDVAMKRLFGVTRGDLYDMNKGRVGNEQPNVRVAKNPRGSQSAENIQTPANTQRMLDIIGEAGRHEGLKRTDAWYVMDPMYWRLKELFGPEEAVRRYRDLNTMTGMASPGSEVLTEIQRGTAAHWLHNQGRFSDFRNLAGLAEEKRGAGFPADMRYIEGHPYHSTSQAGPMQKYVDTGAIQSDAPKVPLYTHASGVPETGFQTTGQVGDAHWSRGVGLADTRKGPTDVGGSFSTPEYQTSQPWWQHKVAGAAGLESVPAQARVWNVLGPQTGVTSELGAPKLELFAKQIMKAAHRLGVSPETARDLILSGKAGAGILAGAVMAPSVLGYRSREAQ